MTKIELPSYYYHMIDKKLIDRLVTNPNDSFGRRSLYVKYKFPVYPISSFVELLKSIKKHLDSNNVRKYTEVDLNGLKDQRRLRYPKLPNGSRLGQILDSMEKDNVTVLVKTDHLLKRKYIKSKMYTQAIDVRHMENISSFIPLLKSMQKYHALKNNYNYKPMQIAFNSHEKCVLNSIKLAKLNRENENNITPLQAELRNKLHKTLIGNCKILEVCNQKSRSSINFEQAIAYDSEKIDVNYKRTEIANHLGYGIPNINDLIENYLGTYVVQYVNELNASKTFKKPFKIKEWIGDMYYIYARYILHTIDIKGIQDLWKT